MENEQTKNSKKVVGIVIDVILWLFVIFALIVTVIAVSANANAKNVPTVGGKCFLSVLTDSMAGDKPESLTDENGNAVDMSKKYNGFKKGVLLISEYIAEDAAKIDALEVGDIITFEWDINENGYLDSGERNTHRIISISRNDDGTITSVVTKGDNSSGSETVTRSKILAKYTGKKIAVLGSVIYFLNTKLGFGLCILLPLVLFFVYRLVVFILMIGKVKNTGKKVITAADEEIIRQKAVEEYLRRQKEAEALKEAEAQAVEPEVKEETKTETTPEQE